MNWAPVTMRWPSQSTQWLSQLVTAKQMAGSELANTASRLETLKDMATTSPGPVAELAKQGIEVGRSAMADALGEIPACLVVTPFQSGVGQGTGLLRALAAPNLLQLLSAKLKDSHDTGLPTGQQYALVILFLGTRYDQFAATLARFNALLPFPDLERAQRRAQQLFKLEAEKWELPSAGALPRWGQMPLERCTVTKAASQALSSQLAALEGYAADSSPMADLAALAARKATQAQAHDRKLAELQQLLTGSTAETTMQCRLIGPGNGAELSAQLLEGQAPGHEWGICAGMVLVGSRKGLSFVQEMIGL